MAQQINLSTPILLAQKRYFSANTMAIGLGAFLVLGGVLSAAWVWNFDRGIATFNQSMAAQAQEVDSLKAAIERSKANAAPVNPALLEQLQRVRNTVAQREKLQAALQEGMFRQGWGHSDRLTWVARSIPDVVWLTDVKMDGSRFEVTGFTLEPAALNEWVDKLAVSPLMQGLKLATVKVENATAALAAQAVAPASAPSAPAAPARAVWSFNLVSVEPPPAAALDAASAPGSKP
ncbi:MAG: PilN domain-containing protein [Burkholderiales bacterium]